MKTEWCTWRGRGWGVFGENGRNKGGGNMRRRRIDINKYKCIE